MRLIRQEGILTILVSWCVSVYEISQVAVGCLFLSLKDLGYDPGVGWLSSSPGTRLGLRLVVVVVGQWWCISFFPSRYKSKY